MKLFKRRRARHAAYQLLLTWNEFVQQDQERRAKYIFVRNGKLIFRTNNSISGVPIQP